MLTRFPRAAAATANCRLRRVMRVVAQYDGLVDAISSVQVYKRIERADTSLIWDRISLSWRVASGPLRERRAFLIQE
jgi:hypothetical protein